MQNSIFLCIGAWNIYSRALRYDVVDGMIFIVDGIILWYKYWWYDSIKIIWGFGDALSLQN